MVQDLSKRYGNLKGGVNDIKNHRFFKNMDWNVLLKEKIKAPYIPKVSGSGDCGNFNVYEDDDDDDAVSISPSEDPFADW